MLEGLPHVLRHTIAGHRAEVITARAGQKGADHVGAERMSDLASHPSHRLRWIERRAQGAAHGEECFRLPQSPLLTAQQLGPLDLLLLAIGHIAQHREVPVVQEMSGRGVLHVAHGRVGTHQAQLTRLPAGRQEGPPRGVETDVGMEEVIEATSHEVGGGRTEELLGRGIHVDEDARVIDNQHRIQRGCEERLEVLIARHRRLPGETPCPTLRPARHSVKTKTTRDSVAAAERRHVGRQERLHEAADVARIEAEIEAQAVGESALDLEPRGLAILTRRDADHGRDPERSPARLQRQRLGVVTGEPRTHATQGGGAAEQDVFGRALNGYFL